MRATPDKSSIPVKDGQPDTVELIPGPVCECGECPPQTIYGFGVPIDADHIRRTAEKVQALATLADAEVPSDFAELMEQMAEEAADDGHAHAVLETFTACWN